MTNREFFTLVQNADIIDERADDMKKFAAEALVKLDERNAKRNSKPSKKQVENEAIMRGLLPLVLEKPMTASEAGVELGISTSKASALLRKLVERGDLRASDVKVKGKGTIKQYSAPTDDEG